MTDARREIRSIIYRKFDTEKACAEALGWPKQRLNNITNGKKEPTVSEIAAIARTVEAPVETLAEVFCRMMLPNG